MTTDCAHAECACLALPGMRYCSEYCQVESQAAAKRRDPGQLRATGHICRCGHADCEARVSTGQATHEQAR